MQCVTKDGDEDAQFNECSLTMNVYRLIFISRYEGENGQENSSGNACIHLYVRINVCIYPPRQHLLL